MMIEQTAETYAWYVIYDEHTGFHEFDVNSFADVDQARVKTLLLLQGTQVSHRVDIPQGAQPIFFRRRRIEINLRSEQASDHTTTHCIGWKRGDEAVYLFAFDDGSTYLTTDLQAV